MKIRRPLTKMALLQLSPPLFRVKIVEIIRYIHPVLQREVIHDRRRSRSGTGRTGASSWYVASLLRKETCFDLDRHLIWPGYPASPMDSRRSIGSLLPCFPPESELILSEQSRSCCPGCICNYRHHIWRTHRRQGSHTGKT